MKLLPIISFLTLSLFTLSTLAVAPQKAVIVSYPNDTPDSIISEAKAAIRRAGGIVTHEYKLIKGFAAQASSKALETVHALSDAYLPTIEEDSIVSTNGNLIPGRHAD